jgi:hypothetical protein
MALFRAQRLGGWVRDTAVDWHMGRWRVEVRFYGGRVCWNWVTSPEAAAEQRMEAEALRPQRWPQV